MWNVHIGQEQWDSEWQSPLIMGQKTPVEAIRVEAFLDITVVEAEVDSAEDQVKLCQWWASEQLTDTCDSISTKKAMEAAQIQEKCKDGEQLMNLLERMIVKKTDTNQQKPIQWTRIST